MLSFTHTLQYENTNNNNKIANTFTENEEYKKLGTSEINKSSDQNYLFHSDVADLMNWNIILDNLYNQHPHLTYL